MIQHVKNHNKLPDEPAEMTADSIKLLLVSAAELGQEAEEKEVQAAGFLNKKPSPSPPPGKRRKTAGEI
jgi:hypothetical protein